MDLNLFGEIVGADDSVRLPQMQLSEIGEVVSDCWNKINEIYSHVSADIYCLMPNHIHGIIEIAETGGQGRPPLQKIIQGYKSVTARLCFKYGYKTIWQRSYYEHIIRDEKDLQKISEYIINNPAKWQEDKYFT